MTVLLFTWYAFADESPIGHLFSLVNLVVHSFMYTYYAFQTMGHRFPRIVPMSLTALQISQMLLGMYLLSLRYHESGKPGNQCGSSIIWISGVLMYASYFALFLHFFYRSYIRRSPTSDSSKRSESNHVPKKRE